MYGWARMQTTDFVERLSQTVFNFKLSHEYNQLMTRIEAFR